MNAIFRWSITTWSFGASNFLSAITSTYTAMFSAYLMACTLTLPSISLAQPWPTRASARPATTDAFTAILDRFMTFLSYLVCVRLSFRPDSLENVVDARLERVRAEEERVPGYRIRV